MREVAVHSCVTEEINHTNYLRCPEIVEDICNAYFERFGESIVEQLLSVWQPRIVKFRWNNIPDRGDQLLSAAILYTYCVVNDQDFSEFSQDADTGFENKGVGIPSAYILSVEPYS